MNDHFPDYEPSFELTDDEQAIAQRLALAAMDDTFSAQHLASILHENTNDARSAWAVMLALAAWVVREMHPGDAYDVAFTIKPPPRRSATAGADRIAAWWSAARICGAGAIDDGAQLRALLRDVIQRAGARSAARQVSAHLLGFLARPETYPIVILDAWPVAEIPERP
jgi:hypothetical protein